MIFLGKLKDALTLFSTSIGYARINDDLAPCVQDGSKISAAFAKAGLGNVNCRLLLGHAEKEGISLSSAREKVLFALSKILGPHVTTLDCSNGRQHWMVLLEGVIDMSGKAQKFSADAETVDDALKILYLHLINELGGFDALKPSVIAKRQDQDRDDRGPLSNSIGQQPLQRPIYALY